VVVDGASVVGVAVAVDVEIELEASAAFVEGPWRYEQIEGVSHWIPLDAPDRLNQLLLEWLK